MKKFLGGVLSLVLISSVFAGARPAEAASDEPLWMIAPAIGLFSPVEEVGTTAKGEMAVPSGHTMNVGWYKFGVAPGETGTAVFDAHVFAAFSKLAYLNDGDDLYIYMRSGKLLHYTVSTKRTYALRELSPSTLFSPASQSQLNLITCAGILTADRSTYTHRLIVSAKLV